VQSRNVRFHGWPRASWKRSELRCANSRGKAEASFADSGSCAAESKRPPGAANATPDSRARGCCPGSRTTRPAIEPQISGALGAEYFAPGAATLRRLRTTLPAEHLAQEGLPVSRETLRKPKYHVPAEHPWRKPWNRTFLLCVDTQTPTRRRRTSQPSFWLFELGLSGLASGTFVLTPWPRRAEKKNPRSGASRANKVTVFEDMQRRYSSST
jgi:hypothetical protein